MIITAEKTNESWTTISRILQVADFQIYKAKEDKRNKQMLWKCGARRFKFK